MRTLFVALSSFAAVASAATAVLANENGRSITEEQATEKLTPVLKSGMKKNLHNNDIEYVVSHGFWDLAQQIIEESHEQKYDISFAVRKATKEVKNRCDELVRALNPKSKVVNDVTPVYRWAQNDTSVQLTVKYAVKWDAPGAIDISEPSVNVTDDRFVFSALGAHSGMKYKYTLDLDVFDFLDPAETVWSTASVGRMQATMIKKSARKWPRMLVDKKNKGTGRLLVERQDVLDAQMDGLQTATNSAKVCYDEGKIFCPEKDTCYKENCNKCTGMTNVERIGDSGKYKICAGLPSKAKQVEFDDKDLTQNIIGGEIRVTNDRNNPPEEYSFYWGKNSTHKIEGLPIIGDFDAGTPRQKFVMADILDISVPPDDVVPKNNGELCLVLYGKNKHGESPDGVGRCFKDKYTPKGVPTGLEFHDEDGDEDKVGGNLKVSGPKTDDTIEEYAVHFGKSKTKRVSGDSLFKTIGARNKKDGSVSVYVDRGKKIPSGANWLIAYAKNQFAENPDGFAVALEDNTRPCAGPEWKYGRDCPPKVWGGEMKDSYEIELDTALGSKDTPATAEDIVIQGSNERSCMQKSNGTSVLELDDNGWKHVVGEDGKARIYLSDNSAEALTKGNEAMKEKATPYKYVILSTKNVFGLSKHCTPIKFKPVEPKAQAPPADLPPIGKGDL